MARKSRYRTYLNRVTARNTRAIIIVPIAAFALLGYGLLRSGHAATYASTGEAESAALSGAVSRINDTSASAVSAIKFGATAPSTPAAPKVFTGGTSIAIRWEPSIPGGTASISRYVIFRDGNQVATVDPTVTNTLVPTTNGTGYLDTAVAAGKTYRYQVQAIDNSGLLSSVSTSTSATQPTSSQSIPAITVDSSQASDLAAYMNDTVVPFVKVWYPKMANIIAYPDYTAPTSYTLKLDPTYDGVAYAQWDQRLIVASSTYVRNNQSDLAMWLHESTHIAQGYITGNSVPGWITEGIADYSREYILQDRYPKPPYPGDPTYTAGYSQGSYFLNWIQRTYDGGFIRKLNIASHNGTYTDNLFVQSTGKTISQLYSTMISSTYSKGATGQIKFKQLSNKCVDYGTVSGSSDQRLTVQPCGTASTQQWTTYRYSDGSLLFLANPSSAGCLQSGGSNGYARGCGDYGQYWLQRSDGSLFNTRYLGCLAASDPASPDGTGLIQLPCTGTSTQAFQPVP